MFTELICPEHTGFYARFQFSWINFNSYRIEPSDTGCSFEPWARGELYESVQSMVLLPRNLTQNEAANAGILCRVSLRTLHCTRILCKLRVTILESTCFCNDPFPNDPMSEWLTLMISSKSTGECTCDDWSMIGNTSHGTSHNIYIYIERERIRCHCHHKQYWPEEV